MGHHPVGKSQWRSLHKLELIPTTRVILNQLPVRSGIAAAGTRGASWVNIEARWLVYPPKVATVCLQWFGGDRWNDLVHDTNRCVLLNAAACISSFLFGWLYSRVCWLHLPNTKGLMSTLSSRGLIRITIQSSRSAKLTFWSRTSMPFINATNNIWNAWNAS